MRVSITVILTLFLAVFVSASGPGTQPTSGGNVLPPKPRLVLKDRQQPAVVGVDARPTNPWKIHVNQAPPPPKINNDALLGKAAETTPEKSPQYKAKLNTRPINTSNFKPPPKINNGASLSNVAVTTPEKSPQDKAKPHVNQAPPPKINYASLSNVAVSAEDKAKLKYPLGCHVRVKPSAWGHAGDVNHPGYVVGYKHSLVEVRYLSHSLGRFVKGKATKDVMPERLRFFGDENSMVNIDPLWVDWRSIGMWRGKTSLDMDDEELKYFQDKCKLDGVAGEAATRK